MANNNIQVEKDDDCTLPVMKTDVRVVSYYSRNHANKIRKYSSEIGSSRMSNTVRSIVVKFLDSHFEKNAVVN